MRPSIMPLLMSIKRLSFFPSQPNSSQGTRAGDNGRAIKSRELDSQPQLLQISLEDLTSRGIRAGENCRAIKCRELDLNVSRVKVSVCGRVFIIE